MLGEMYVRECSITHSWVLTSNYYTSSSRTRLLDPRDADSASRRPPLILPAVQWNTFDCVCFRSRSVKPLARATRYFRLLFHDVFFFFSRPLYFPRDTFIEQTHSKISIYFSYKEPDFNTFLVLFSNYLGRFFVEIALKIF